MFDGACTQTARLGLASVVTGTGREGKLIFVVTSEIAIL